MNNTQKQSSYGELHNKKKYSNGDKDSYIHFLEEQLKKLTDSLVDNENIKERLEIIEGKVERISEKSDKMQKINKLLQTCVDNQEEDLKTFKDKIYLDIDMKCKVIESKFDVDDKLLNQESNLNKKFNSRQRDFDKIVDTFEKKIQINYDEFSSEIAIDLKQIENKVEDRISQIKDDVLFWVKEELDNKQRDRQIYSQFQEFRCNISEQFELQKTELNAYFEVLNTKTKSQLNDFTQKIEERLQNYEYTEQHPAREDENEKQKYRKDVLDLKYITNLIMEKVEKLEDNGENSQHRQSPLKQKQSRTSSVDKIEKKIVNQMSSQFEKLSNIIKQLQDQQFSIEKKIMNMDSRNSNDIMKITQKQDEKQDFIIEERLQNAQTIKQTQNNNSQDLRQRKLSVEKNTSQGDKYSQLGDKYSLISEKLKQRRMQEEDQANYNNYSQKENDKNYNNKKQTTRDESISHSPLDNKNKYDIDRSQNTESLNESIDDLLSQRKNILYEKSQTRTQQLTSPQSTQYGLGKNSYKQSLQSSQEKISKYSDQKEKETFNLNSNEEKSHKQNENNNQNQSQNYQSSNQRQNIFELRNNDQNKQISHPPQADSFKRRSFDDRSMLNNIPKPVNGLNEQKYHIKTEEYEQYKPQSRMQKSNSLNRFEEIQQRNIQNSPTNQIDDNLADHLEQRRERLRKFIEQTEQQLEEANNGFEEKINKKYETMKDQQKPTQSQVNEQKFKSIQNNQNEKRFSPYSSQKNQYRGEGYYKDMNDNNPDFSATFDDKSLFQNSDMKNSYGNKYDDEDEFNDKIYPNNFKTIQQPKNNQIFNAGDDSDIIRLNHRIMTAENNTMDSFSRDILPSRSMSRENAQKINSQNTANIKDEKLKYEKGNNKNKYQIKSLNQDPKRTGNMDSDSDDEEISKVLQKYNNTKVNIKDLIEKKKEEEQLLKKQQQNKLIQEKITSPTSNNPYIERGTPASKISNTSAKKPEYYEVGDKTRDLLRDDDDRSYNISASNINQSEMINIPKQDKYQKQENKYSKSNNPQQKSEIQNKKYNQDSAKTAKSSNYTEPQSQSKKDVESFFYTKGLKYDFNFSNNTSKSKDQSKSFSMIDKVMNATQKQKK